VISAIAIPFLLLSRAQHDAADTAREVNKDADAAADAGTAPSD
jgi:hypothetical protein